MRKKKYAHTEICYSCCTGEAVWIYRGSSKEAAALAYYRMVYKERHRRRRYARLIVQRTRNIARLLQDCQEVLPIIGQLTKEQREAIMTLQQLVDSPPDFCSPFLEHDRERRHKIRLAKRRQRYWRDAQFRAKEKERIRRNKKTCRISVMINSN